MNFIEFSSITLKKQVIESPKKKLADGIHDEPSKLKTHPEIGQIEQFLDNRKQSFRYLIYKKNHKIIYWLNNEENRVEIIDVFDVRQNPPKLRRTK